MTDEQLDEIDQAMSDGAVTWYQLERLTAEVRRLRELERAVRYVIIRDIGPKGITWRLNPYSNQLHSAAVATIGRLLEESHAD